MTRLQENIGKLKAEEGEEDSDDKVQLLAHTGVLAGRGGEGEALFLLLELTKGRIIWNIFTK